MFHVEQFLQQITVSRETADRLKLYADLLVKWQAKINLVGPATIPELWRRHMLDSAQLWPLLEGGPIVDLGSGAGFPGLVLAILRGSADPVHLVESDARKCAFLREVARQTDAVVTIHNRRIESIAAFPVATITARALAPVTSLLTLAEPFLQPSTQCLFLKGEKFEDELTAAAKDWNMSCERIPSRTDPNGVILRLREVHRGSN